MKNLKLLAFLVTIPVFTLCPSWQTTFYIDRLPIIAKGSFGELTFEALKAPKGINPPDLCNGSISASPNGVTYFEISNRACVTFSWSYTVCTGIQQPACCIDSTCTNVLGWGTDPTQTTDFHDWNHCNFHSGTYSRCLDAGTYYFKAIVVASYDCQASTVTISADCSQSPWCCP